MNGLVDLLYISLSAFWFHCHLTFKLYSQHQVYRTTSGWSAVTTKKANLAKATRKTTNLAYTSRAIEFSNHRHCQYIYHIRIRLPNWHLLPRTIDAKLVRQRNDQNFHLRSLAHMCSFTCFLFNNCRNPQQHQSHIWEISSCLDSQRAGVGCVLGPRNYFPSEPEECRTCTGQISAPLEAGVLEAMPNSADLRIEERPEERDYEITRLEICRCAQFFNLEREERGRRTREIREEWEVVNMQTWFLAYCWSQFVGRYRSE